MSFGYCINIFQFACRKKPPCSSTLNDTSELQRFDLLKLHLGIFNWSAGFKKLHLGIKLKVMKKYQLGEFEEIVLLTVGVLYGEAYGVAIKEEIEKRLNRKVSVGALQSALRRMEEKGFLKSEFGESTKTRGGKRKRYFKITAFGKKALDFNIQTRLDLWNEIPDVAFQFKIC